MSEKGLVELHKQHLLGTSDLEKLPACEEWILGKSKRQSVSAGNHVISSVFEYVHSDIWGPAKVQP